MRVLHVDDDRVNSLLFAEACRLASAGLATAIEVESAESGADALSLATRWQPQLLVLDLHLPDTSGLALLPQLRAELQQPCQAWLCTAEDSAGVQLAATAAGFDGCWSKPLSLPELMTALAGLARVVEPAGK